MSKILDESGAPVASDPAAASAALPPAGTPREAPIALTPVFQGIRSGPITISVKVDFNDVRVGGEAREHFVKACEALAIAGIGYTCRAIELMLMGAAKDTDTAPFVAGSLDDVTMIRKGLEAILGRVAAGLDPIPMIEQAPPGSRVLPGPGSELRR